MWIPPAHSLRRSVHPVAAPDCQSSQLLAPSHTSLRATAPLQLPVQTVTHTHTHRTGRYSGPPKPAPSTVSPLETLAPPSPRLPGHITYLPACPVRSSLPLPALACTRVLTAGAAPWTNGPLWRVSRSSCWRSDLHTHTSGRASRKKKVRNGV